MHLVVTRGERDHLAALRNSRLHVCDMPAPPLKKGAEGRDDRWWQMRESPPVSRKQGKEAWVNSSNSAFPEGLFVPSPNLEQAEASVRFRRREIRPLFPAMSGRAMAASRIGDL